MFPMHTIEFDEPGCMNKNDHGGAKTKYGKKHTNGKSTSPHDVRAVLSSPVCGDVFHIRRSPVYMRYRILNGMQVATTCICAR